MKLFILLSRVPYPIEKGDKLRAYHQLRLLSERHEIHLCVLNDGPLDERSIPELQKFCKTIHIMPLRWFCIGINLLRALFNGNPLQVGYFFSARFRKQIHRLIQEIKPDRIFCQLIRVAEYVKDIPVNKTLDYQDVFSKGVERRMQKSIFMVRPFFSMEYHRLLRYEYKVFGWFNHKTIISGADKELIPHPERNQITVILNGVDMDYFHPRTMEKTHDLVFIGNMAYPPNIDSACFLARKILPRLRKTKPGIRLLIAGATPHPRVLALQGPDITVRGSVPDVRECYASARIFIAPMQMGTGLQNKLLEAMAMKLPCITSPLANKALGAKEGEEILVGNTPEDYASMVLDLLTHPAKADELASRGHAFVGKQYSWEKETRKLEDIIIQS